MPNIPLAWSSRYTEVLSEEYLHTIFPQPDYRLSTRKYPHGTKFSGRMREGKCFVLSGTVRFYFEGMTILINEGYFCELPGGDYDLEIDSAVEAKFVLVWNLEKLREAGS